jgi:hypothetical protein
MTFLLPHKAKFPPETVKEFRLLFARNMCLCVY